MRLNKKKLIDDLLPILERNNDSAEVKKKVISYFRENGIADISTTINFLNGNCDYFLLTDDQLYKMVEGLVRVYDTERVPYSLNLASYTVDSPVQSSLAYNSICFANCFKTSKSMYFVNVNANIIYDLFYREMFNFDYLAAMPELKIKLDRLEKMLTAGNELKISKMVKELKESPEIPMTIQLNIWSLENGEITYLPDDKILKLQNLDLDVIDVGSFYTIYAISKLTNEKIRNMIQVNCLLYELDEMALAGYRQRYAASLAINAKYFEVQEKKDPSVLAVEDIRNRPGMSNVITSTGGKGIKAGRLLPYFSRYFQKRKDFEEIKDLFTNSLLAAYDTAPEKFESYLWSVRDTGIVCRTIDMCNRKGITDPHKIGKLILILTEDKQFNLRVSYKDIAESCFADFDRRLEELL